MMTELKLAKLPDRTPVKLVVNGSPELHRLLGDYAEAYRRAYGKAESVADLVPYILRGFLDGDRAFARDRASIRRDAHGE